MKHSATIRRCHFLGVHVDAIDESALNGAIVDAVCQDRRIVVANHNLHSLYLLRLTPSLRAFFEAAEIIHIDGMPLVWIGRSLGWPLSRTHRTTYVDWFPRLIELAAQRGWRVFYCGSKPGVAERGMESLRQRYPRLQARSAHGYLDGPTDTSSDEIIDEIAAYRPHLLFVGMGMPKQELWILQNRHRLEANVILPSGAAIDYVAGVIPTPPRWLGRVGLEWLYRLVSEPRRLGRRYLVEPWTLLYPYARELAERAFAPSSRHR